jgi:hypothetical protein
MPLPFNLITARQMQQFFDKIVLLIENITLHLQVVKKTDNIVVSLNIAEKIYNYTVFAK